jgi:polyisoprenyl-teichoic acid--peptidoglycan teichoic acid transferase
MNVKRIILFIFCIALVAALVIAGVMALRIKSAAENPISVFFGDEIVIPEAEIIDEPAIIEVDLVRNEKSYVKKENIVSIAVLGRDATPVKEYRDDGGNTDIMIVMAVDLNDGSVKAISIPRDSVAHIYHYKNAKPEIDGEYFDKLNGAYGAGGPNNEDEVQLSNSVTCIAEHLNAFGTFDVVINNYVEIGLTGLRELTDAVGGVEVTMASGIPGVGSKGQTVNLSGKTAMTFVRDRHNSGGDLGRVSNSQTYIKALAKKLQSMGAAEIAPDIASTFVSKNLMRTDLTIEEIAALASLVADIDVDGLSMKTISAIEANNIKDFKDHLKGYGYDYEAFYGAEKWEDLKIKKGDEYDFGFFTEYDSLEEIMLDVYYEELVQ